MTTPAELYRNAVDLNRFSNGVARQIAATYNDAVLEVVNQLAGLDADTAPVKAARLRALLAQLQGSLDNWAGQSTELMVEQMQGLTELQAEFAATELREVLPESAAQQVKSVQISPSYARSVATTDPMRFNFVALSDDLDAAVKGAPQVAQLTAAKGTSIVLPNGRSLQQSFQVLAQVNVETFNREVRNGLLIGESADKIARRLKGRLRQGQTGSVKQLTQKGGQLTARANREVSTLVRTSMNQVANAASQQVYQANQDVTKKYRYVATLDGRTSPICRSLDGREFKYGKGPQPPQHFNCRSTTVPVVDYKGLGLSAPPPGRRKAAQGTVPANQTYGKWLSNQSKTDRAKILGGKKRAEYFDKLSKKLGPEEAIRRFVKDDGTEVSLDYLRREYASVLDAKPKPKPKPKAKPKPVVIAKPPKAALKTYTGRNFDSVRAQQFNAAQKKGKKLSSYQEAQVRKIGINDKHLKQADEIESFLQAAPKYEGTVQRGMNMPKKALDDMLASYKAGGESFAMESWTSGKVLNDFTVGADQHVILRAENKRGVDIAQYSEFANEKEVLMPTGSRYTLKGLQKEEISPGLTKKGIFRWIVDLEQE